MRAIIIIILVLALSLSVSAQAVTDAEECRDAAQAWYDNINAEKYRESNWAITSSTSRNSQRFAGLEGLIELKGEISQLDYPSCVELPREWYLIGLESDIADWTAILDGTTNRTSLYGVGMHSAQLIGQFRGYLIMLGVEVDYQPEVAVYLK